MSANFSGPQTVDLVHLFPEAKYAEAKILGHDSEVYVRLTFLNGRQELLVLDIDQMSNSLDRLRQAQSKYPRKRKT